MFVFYLSYLAEKKDLRIKIKIFMNFIKIERNEDGSF